MINFGIYIYMLCNKFILLYILRRRSIMKLTSLIVISLAMLLVPCAAYASVDSMYEVAVVDHSGDVKVDPGADGNWVDPYVGMKLKEGALIKTGAAAYIDVVYDAEGLNLLRINEASDTAIEVSSVNLNQGTVFAKFDNLKDGKIFSVKTPTSTCGIRGSSMGVDFINNMTVVRAFEDNVYVQGVDSAGNVVGKEVVIPEGWKTQVLQNGNTEPPAELSENEQIIFTAWVEAVTGSPPGSNAADDIEEEAEEDVDSKDLQDKKEISPSE